MDTTTPLSRPVARPGLVALALAPVLALAAQLTQVAPLAHDTASELTSIAAHTGRYQLAGFLGFAAMLLYVPGYLTMAAGLQGARPRAAAAGAVMSVTGTLALTALMGSGPLSQALAESPERDAMISATDAYESLPLTNLWVLLMLLGFSLGPVVLGLGLWRAGHSWAIPALLVTGLVVQMADAGTWPLTAGFALTAAGLGLAAWSLHRGTPPSEAPSRDERSDWASQG